MNKMKYIKPVLILLMGTVIGFSCCHLFHSNCSGVAVPVAGQDFKSSELEKKVKTIETTYQEKEDVITKKNDELNRKLQQTQTALGKTRIRNNQLQSQIFTLINRQQVYKAGNDTAGYITGCDSLQAIASQFIVYANQLDSLTQVSIANLSSQLQNKDSAIMLKYSQYQALKVMLNQSLAQQEQLEKETKFYKKQCKRQRLVSKVKSIGLLIISGLVARQLIH
jgi:hypothetical protein